MKHRSTLLMSQRAFQQVMLSHVSNAFLRGWRTKVCLCTFVCVSAVHSHSSDYHSAVFTGIINACLLLCNVQQWVGGVFVPGERRQGVSKQQAKSRLTVLNLFVWYLRIDVWEICLFSVQFVDLVPLKLKWAYFELNKAKQKDCTLWMCFQTVMDICLLQAAKTFTFSS